MYLSNPQPFHPSLQASVQALQYLQQHLDLPCNNLPLDHQNLLSLGVHPGNRCPRFHLSSISALVNNLLLSRPERIITTTITTTMRMKEVKQQMRPLLLHRITNEISHLSPQHHYKAKKINIFHFK